MMFSPACRLPSRLLFSSAAVVLIVTALLPLGARGEDETAALPTTRFVSKANQGVAVDGEYYYAISNTTIRKYRQSDETEVAVWQSQDDPKFDYFQHMNSGVVWRGNLYVAHSNNDEDLNTIEIWNVAGGQLDHERTIRLDAKVSQRGAVTWADRDAGGKWWVCYAVYGKENARTRLFRCELTDKGFEEKQSFAFPDSVVRLWKKMSASGGSWGPDGLLYTTGHDDHSVHVLQPRGEELVHIASVDGVAFYGQGVAWDRAAKADKRYLWGIRKTNGVYRCEMPPVESKHAAKTSDPQSDAQDD